MDIQIRENVDRQFIEELLREEATHFITLYMPVETAGPETRQNPIRYKNLVNSLTQRTEEREWLQALHQLEEDPTFWQAQKQGVALFSTPKKVTVVSLPFRPEEKAQVGKRYEILPILPLLEENQSFFILKINLNKMQLLLGSRFGELTEVPIQGEIFTSLEAYLETFELTQELQFRTIPGSSTGGGRGGAIFHGHGDVTAEQKTQIRRFFDQYQAGLKELIQENPLPIVLVGVDYLLPLFREAFSPSTLIKDYIAQQPETLSEEDLTKQAWACLQQEFQQEEQKERQLYQEVLSTNRTTPFITDIIPYAREGRVQTLFIRKNALAWGRYNPEKNEVRLHTEQQPNSESLWERAAQEAFLTGAKVFMIESEDSLLNSEAGAALLRY
jgi:hypothetical protein